jgi:ABC-type Mn2+/Zn2+ transport system ATPase subunit
MLETVHSLQRGMSLGSLAASSVIGTHDICLAPIANSLGAASSQPRKWSSLRRQILVNGSEPFDTVTGPPEVDKAMDAPKSTLIRAMAGLWPWGSGEILRPEGAHIAFLPQRPYFPLGTLRTALLYPHTDHEVPDHKIREILTRCGLDHLLARLDEADQWSSILSGGEQQRLAFARVLIRPPDILIMDEPTSSLDELSQFKLMEYMRDLLADTMVIHAGHRPGLERFHDREIRLVREMHDGPTTTQERDFPLRTFVSRALQEIGRKRSI